MMKYAVVLAALLCVVSATLTLEDYASLESTPSVDTTYLIPGTKLRYEVGVNAGGQEEIQYVFCDGAASVVIDGKAVYRIVIGSDNFPLEQVTAMFPKRGGLTLEGPTGGSESCSKGLESYSTATIERLSQATVGGQKLFVSQQNAEAKIVIQSTFGVGTGLELPIVDGTFIRLRFSELGQFEGVFGATLWVAENRTSLWDDGSYIPVSCPQPNDGGSICLWKFEAKLVNGVPTIVGPTGPFPGTSGCLNAPQTAGTTSYPATSSCPDRLKLGTFIYKCGSCAQPPPPEGNNGGR